MREADSTGKYCITGVLDFTTITPLLQQACQFIDNQAAPAIVDLAEVKQSNSAGLALLIALLRYANAQQKKIIFTHLPAKLLAAAKISNLDKLLPCKP